MARLTYAALALALGALVSGFFIRTTAVPLFASIGLSALVLLLILRGWARRLKETPDGDELEVDDIEEIEVIDAGDIVVVDPDAVSVEHPAVVPRAARKTKSPETTRRETIKPRSRPRPVHTPRTRTPGGASSRRVVVLPGRSRYHIAGCRFAHGKGAEEISEATARRRHFQPCSVCLGD